MASSCGKSITNSSASSPQQQNSGSDHQRKRRRMESNRESARRSRVRKQKHLDDLVAQITELKSDNNQIQSSIGFTTQHYMNMEAQNSVLRAQMMELSQRLESLNEILDRINSPTACNGVYEAEAIEFNPFSLPCLNQQGCFYYG
ncbi:bZIP transcription factor 44-like [Hibiscus syriacus]|uniref:bZIP transcription factor 44-like n=1 Tax=Hibiscus syriacus TaxID=106335 RepID=UPI001922F475|nr:bZIP transcription factor 44-like [Hibiscus syriacus]